MQGIKAGEVEATVKTMIDELGLGQYADKMAGGYSGGNKRKLSVAVAMIGNPQIVFLVRHPDTVLTTTITTAATAAAVGLVDPTSFAPACAGREQHFCLIFSCVVVC